MSVDVTITQAIFGMGTWETMIILIVALIFLGPDKLPEVAKKIGQGMRTLRRAMSSVEYEVQAMTQPERYRPPPRAQATSAMNQRATDAADAAEASSVGDPDSTEPSADGDAPLDADPEVDALLKAVHGDASDDLHAPPADYDLHRPPDTPDGGEASEPPSDNGTVAAAHPYRPASPQPEPEPSAESAPAAAEEEAKAT